MKVDKIKIINEEEGDIIVQVGVTVFTEKDVSFSKEMDLKDLMRELSEAKADELIIRIRKKED